MIITIQNSSPDPIYKQIFDQIKKQIICGDLKAGEKLPSIREMAKELSISIITIKRTYTDLENEKLIETVIGKGSFVSDINNELLKEKKFALLQDLIEKIVDEAKKLGISKKEIVEVLDEFY
ncbi:MAG: GntR family transcriptional regulator [Candidatus Delongbacteria bacterium]|nr:GntR family transcriptional regulator [Candidatus Delongbacteria bacterium]MBN2834375.1 GntR family transcriptional regulator [Candidatus Delongbacteria bacterium]